MHAVKSPPGGAEAGRGQRGREGRSDISFSQISFRLSSSIPVGAAAPGRAAEVDEQVCAARGDEEVSLGHHHRDDRRRARGVAHDELPVMQAPCEERAWLGS